MVNPLEAVLAKPKQTPLEKYNGLLSKGWVEHLPGQGIDRIMPGDGIAKLVPMREQPTEQMLLMTVATGFSSDGHIPNQHKITIGINDQFLVIQNGLRKLREYQESGRSGF